MIRVQVNLDEHQHAFVKAEANRLGISVTELIRRAIRQALPPSGGAPMRYAGLVDSGDVRSSQRIDESVD